MPPETLQSIADANGMPIEHFDGYSVVHHPDHGPLTIPHAESSAASMLPMSASPSAPAAAPPTQRIALPEMRITAPSAERQARIAADDAAIEQQLAYTRGHGRTPEQDRRRELDYVQDRAPRMGADGSLPPEVQRDLDRWTAERTRESEVSAMAGSGRLAHEQDRRASVEESGFPTDGQTYDPEAPVVIPPEVPAAWLPQDARIPGLVDARRSAIAADQQMGARAPVTAMGLPQQIASAGPAATPGAAGAPAEEGVPPMLARPGESPGRATGQRAGGGVPRGAAPTSAPLPLPAMQSDQQFGNAMADLAGQYDPARRAPDLIDRQMLHDQQAANAGRQDALRQISAEREIEQQRQADEADRRGAIAGARNAYQASIDRVANARIEPTRWFRDQGVGGTVAATLAVALGAVGQALGGTNTNLALDEINRAVDRDIDAQRSEIDAGRAAADLTGNMLSITRQEYSDRDAAREAARAAMLRQVALQTQAHVADLTNDEARLHADELHQQLLSAADEADRAAITQELAWREQAARVARTEAEAALAQRRASHIGTGAPHAAPLVTQAHRQAYDAALAQGLSPQQAAAESFPAGSASAASPPAHAALSGEERATVEELSTALQQVQRELPGDAAADIPGFGLTGMFPRLLLSQEGRDLRASIGNLRDAFARDRTGANLPPSELAAFNEILGTADTASDADLRHGLALMQAIIAGHLERSATQDDAATHDLSALGPGARWVDE